MHKATKALFFELKGIHPIIQSISYYYGTRFGSDKIVELWYLEYPNKHIECDTENKLVEEIKKLIATTNNGYGITIPNTIEKLNLKHKNL